MKLSNILKPKGNQGPAVASWINYMNQVRLDRYMSSIQSQDKNLHNALNTIAKAMSEIDTKIIIRNRGGETGMHGFIAEVAETGVSNARAQILGKAPSTIWVNDDGPVDLLRNGIPIQQKFVNSGNHLSLNAVRHHHLKYGSFLKEGGKYQIPADHYEKIKYYLSVSEKQATKMPTQTGEFSLKQWKEVHSFFEDKSNPAFSDFEPSVMTYKSVQKGKIQSTMKDETASLKKTDRIIREKAYQASKASVKEGAFAGVTSAGIEAGFTFCNAIISKVQSGKNVYAFTADDWMDILKEIGSGALKGSFRGVSLYALTNFTPLPAFVANSMITASFGIAEQAHLYREGIISKDDFLINAQVLCVHVSVNALSSTIGQALIPMPILGAVIGNTVGTILVENCQEYLSASEADLILGYLHEIDTLNRNLDDEYYRLMQVLISYLHDYYRILEKAFVFDSLSVLEDSAALARFLGVPQGAILMTVPDVDDYFLG